MPIIVLQQLVIIGTGSMLPFFELGCLIPVLDPPLAIGCFSLLHAGLLSSDIYSNLYFLYFLDLYPDASHPIGQILALRPFSATGQIPLSYFETGYIYSISAIIGFVSMIPGGIGSQELAFIFLCSLRGVSTESSGAAVLLYRSIFLIGNVVVGGTAFFLIGSRVPIKSTIESKFDENSTESNQSVKL